MYIFHLQEVCILSHRSSYAKLTFTASIGIPLSYHYLSPNMLARLQLCRGRTGSAVPVFCSQKQSKKVGQSPRAKVKASFKPSTGSQPSSSKGPSSLSPCRPFDLGSETSTSSLNSLDSYQQLIDLCIQRDSRLFDWQPPPMAGASSGGSATSSSSLGQKGSGAGSVQQGRSPSRKNSGGRGKAQSRATITYPVMVPVTGPTAAPSSQAG